MSNSLFFTILSVIFTFLITSLSLQAQILGPSVTEVNFSYTATFQAPVDHDKGSDVALAEFHASHLFGLLASPKMISRYIGRNAITKGLGGPRTQMKVKILSSKVNSGLIDIKYSNSGKMVLNRLAAKKILTAGSVVLPLPTNPYSIYNINCTDEHYDTFGDYWYFYDPFRQGCEYLSRKPKATDVTLNISAVEYKKLDLTPKLPFLRGDNGNGDLFSIYIISGYVEDGSDKKDEGYKNFKEIRTSFIQQGFQVTSKRTNTTKPLNIYTKSIELDNGKIIEVEVKHLLVETSIETRSKVFAKFFKEAVEKADVIVYSGHSGLGANLDIPSLEEKEVNLILIPRKNKFSFLIPARATLIILNIFLLKKLRLKLISFQMDSRVIFIPQMPCSLPF